MDSQTNRDLTFFCCYDSEGTLIARCQTMADVEVLRRLGRPVVKVVEMEPAEATNCRMKDEAASTGAFNETSWRNQSS